MLFVRRYVYKDCCKKQNLERKKKDLRLQILGNQEIMGKSQSWFGTYPIVQSHCYKLNFGCQIFLVLSNFACLFYFLSNICKKKFAYNSSQSPGNFNVTFFIISVEIQT